jgi:Putative metallopeptidase
MKQIMNVVLAASILVLPALLPTGARAQIADLDNPDIAVEYVPSNKFKALYTRLSKRRVLEQIKQFLSPLKLGPLRVPDGKLEDDPLLIKLRECTSQDTSGVENAWYSSGETSITYCYQYILQHERYAPKVTTPEGLTRDDAIDGTFIGILFHELGHAVVDLFEIPVYGREEDAADQISAYVMLQFGPNVARRTILANAYSWQEAARRDGSSYYLYDTHGTNLQRFYNYLCLGYGGYPDAFKDLIDKPLKGANPDQKFLPARRAANCKNEYEQVRTAFGATLRPHIDLALADRIKATIACIRPNGKWAIDTKC